MLLFYLLNVWLFRGTPFRCQLIHVKQAFGTSRGSWGCSFWVCLRQLWRCSWTPAFCSSFLAVQPAFQASPLFAGLGTVQMISVKEWNVWRLESIECVESTWIDANEHGQTLLRPTGPLDASMKPLIDSLHIEELVNAEASSTMIWGSC